MRLALIINAARTDAGAVAEHIADVCRRQAVELDCEICPGAGLASATRRALNRGSTTVLAGGGDGTISAVAGVLAGTDRTLGVLPLGTLNHFARDLGVPRDLDQALAATLTGRRIPVDIGEVNGRTFINNSSVGLYPRLVWEREQHQRLGHRKLTAAAAAAWTVWRRYRRVTVLLQPENDPPRRVHTPFVFVGNNAYQLTGVEFGSRAALDCGRLQVCMAPELSAVGVLGVLGAALIGHLTDVKQFESLEARELTIAAHRPRVGVALDGEVTVLPTPLRYRIHQRALNVAVPAAA